MRRRTMLKGVAGAVLLTGCANEKTISKVAAGPVHPGLLHTEADLKRMAAAVRTGAQPWKAGWDRLVANRHAQSTWKARPLENVVRGGGVGENYATLFNDIHAAYQNALRWRITGNSAHGDTARDILNAWSATLKTISGNADRFLAAGIYGYQFANAAELIRDYPGFELERFKQMLLNVFHPLSGDFLTRHNGACITNYWANWDLCNMNAILAIGIFCDDRPKIDRAVRYFKEGAGNGAVKNAIPFVHGNGLAQYQESGRDQGHTVMGVGLLGAFCETAWNQGIDLYGYDDNRVLKACEYIARYNLGGEVPFKKYTWGTGVNCAYREQTVVSDIARGNGRPVWETIYAHYAIRRNLPAPNVAAYVAKARAEGGGGDYGPNSGGFDQLGFGTLVHAREAASVRLTVGATRMLRSVNYPNRYVRHRNLLGSLEPLTQDATWTITEGLAAPNAYSFRGADGRYLIVDGTRVKVGKDDGTSAFKQSATFYARQGSVSGSVSLEAYATPGRYVRHRNYALWSDQRTATALFAADTSFTLA